ncbi:MAG: GNAT family N-acetyltransferase [Actinomycetota bacterium]|jgi:L-amino acid N-acyltransferase|nr:GNAT family N-acetyltransferase [Actinomycetota bacterium]|tara:strand:+ start:121 stop:618 length:498 start_codon:yes stop_codon:yes gene_type:complete
MWIRLAKLSDAAAIAEIYNYEVVSGVATFDLVPKSLEEQRDWLRDRSGALPCIVAVADDEVVVGWACLSKYRDRPAYGTSVENSIYVHPDHQGKGVGGLLMGDLLALADEHGFHATFARIAGENPASVALHAKHGFQLVGVEREVGRKFNRWLDITVMQRLTPTG